MKYGSCAGEGVLKVVLKPHLRPNDGVVPLFSAGPLNLRGLPASGMVLKPLIGWFEQVMPLSLTLAGIWDGGISGCGKKHLNTGKVFETKTIKSGFAFAN